MFSLEKWAPEKCPPLNSVHFFEEAEYIKNSNCCTFEISSLVNILGHYSRKWPFCSKPEMAFFRFEMDFLGGFQNQET